MNLYLIKVWKIEIQKDSKNNPSFLMYKPLIFNSEVSGCVFQRNRLVIPVETDGQFQFNSIEDSSGIRLKF
jgi:hypothetical protein